MSHASLDSERYFSELIRAGEYGPLDMCAKPGNGGRILTNDIRKALAGKGTAAAPSEHRALRSTGRCGLGGI
jgi:hypothetical protein